ncbi:MAG: CotH kinase family protein [Deltaproteobacteria bacterium]|nr:CotH kinase family protein [Deltaproteobacteria bacterium]
MALSVFLPISFIAGCEVFKEEISEPPNVWPTVQLTGTENDIIFKQGQILEYRVTIDPIDIEDIEEHGILEEWHNASLRITGGEIGELDLGEVGFRHKGAYGSLVMCFGPPKDLDGDPEVTTREEMLTQRRLYDGRCNKLSYKFKFAKDRRLFGLKKLNLHTSNTDPTRLREMLAYSLYNDFGVDAPRTAPVRLYINNKFMGLMIAVESIDDRYFKDHLPENDDGNLYKEIWPSTQWVDHDFDPTEFFLEGVEENQQDPADISDFLAFTEAVVATNKQSFLQDMATWVDIDNILHYMAVDRAAKNWDGVTAWYTSGPEPEAISVTPHNFYWYHDLSENGIFHFVPWDLDNTFHEYDPYMDPHGYGAQTAIPDWNVKPRNCDVKTRVWEDSWVVPPGCDKFLNLLAATSWPQFIEIGKKLLNGPLQRKNMLTKIEAWSWLIEPTIKEDPYIEYSDWKNAYYDFKNRQLANIRNDFVRYLKKEYTEQ